MYDPMKHVSSLGLNRRDFLQAAAGAGLMMTLPGFAAAASRSKSDELRIAMIGPGSQGRNLLTQCLKIPDVRFVGDLRHLALPPAVRRPTSLRNTTCR
jgi:hypothetical protein